MAIERNPLTKQQLQVGLVVVVMGGGGAVARPCA